MEIGRELGGVLLAAYPHLKVDVHALQVNVTVEVRDLRPMCTRASSRARAAAGVHIGQGGADAVRRHRQPRGGLYDGKARASLTCIHFASLPYTSERARMKVLKLAKELTPYTGNLNV